MTSLISKLRIEAKKSPNYLRSAKIRTQYYTEHDNQSNFGNISEVKLLKNLLENEELQNSLFIRPDIIIDAAN